MIMIRRWYDDEYFSDMMIKWLRYDDDDDDDNDDDDDDDDMMVIWWWYDYNDMMMI